MSHKRNKRGAPPKPVYVYLRGRLVSTHKSATEAAKAYNVDLPTLSRYCNHNTNRDEYQFTYTKLDITSPPIETPKKDPLLVRLWNALWG